VGVSDALVSDFDKHTAWDGDANMSGVLLYASWQAGAGQGRKEHQR
jgi:hypothetical protein